MPLVSDIDIKVPILMLFGIRGLVDGVDPFLQLVDIFMGHRGLRPGGNR
jgi:hypothetical protein